MTRRILQRLTARKLITRTEQQPGGPTGGSNAPIYYVTRTGAQQLKHTHPAPRSPRGTLLVRHAIASADVVLAFDRAARANVDHELVGWATDAEIGRDLGPLPLLPDLYLTYATTTSNFTRSSRSTSDPRAAVSSQPRSTSTCNSGGPAPLHERLGLWPVVLWVTTNPTRARLLQRAIERVIATQPDVDQAARGTEFAVTTFDQLSEQGAFGPIWQVVGRDERQSLLESETPS